MNNKKCFMCGSSKVKKWYSLWYDGKNREICSLKCRAEVEDLLIKNPEKSYSNSIHKR